MNKISIIMRSHNDMPLVADTLAMVRGQSVKHELIVFDNDSTDGTLEQVKQYADRVVRVPRGTYVPGRVLNQGLKIAQGELVVFLNADCTPTDFLWLERLLERFEDGRVAAVFGRQLPRADCPLLYAKDIDDTYGDGARQARWRHCFSMASSAIRRRVWERAPFDETLQYSEDIDWTWRIRRWGYTVRYAPQSVVWHSHNYTLRQFWRRHYGEGRAEAAIFEWSDWEASLLRYSILPYPRQVLGDWRHAWRSLAIGAALYSPVLRLAQAWGRRAGFLAGRRIGLLEGAGPRRKRLRGARTVT